jgi:hypothetical protein
MFNIFNQGLEFLIHNISIVNTLNKDNDGILDGIITLLQFMKKHIHLAMVITWAPLPTTKRMN